MFLHWLSTSGLLSADGTEPVLASFPLDVRLPVIAYITNHLLTEADDKAALASMHHVWWVMEVVGEAFTLPYHETTVVGQAVDVYSRWLLERKARPAAVVGLHSAADDDLQRFLCRMFKQLAQMFDPRFVANQRPHPTNGSTLALGQGTRVAILKEYGELCKKVLKVFTMTGRLLAGELGAETWRVLLAVVVGVADRLLKEPEHIDAKEERAGWVGEYGLCNELCEPLLRTLFELWLRSGTRDEHMWTFLGTAFPTWTHRLPVVHQWSGTVLALTRRSVRLLYGADEGSGSVDISVNGFNVKLDLPEEFVHFAWYKTLRIVGDAAALPPDHFTEAVLGIGRVSETFLAVGRSKQDGRASAPNGNTILDLVGGWLFGAASQPSNGRFVQGRAEALGFLCRIFSVPQTRQPFHRHYIERFYGVLTVSIRDQAYLPAILLNCHELFASDLAGVRVLVPDFLAGIRVVLPKFAAGFTSQVSTARLRLAAIQIAASLLAVPNHLDGVMLHTGWEVGMPPMPACEDEHEVLVMELVRALYMRDDTTNTPGATFGLLKPRILETLLMSISTETSSYNMRYLLHLVSVYVADDAAHCRGLVGVVVKTIQEKILTFELAPDVVSTALNVLIDFVEYHDYVARDSKNCARELVLSLCRFLGTMMARDKIMSHIHVIVRAYVCMVRWICASMWIAGDQDCHRQVVAMIDLGLAAPDREHEIIGVLSPPPPPPATLSRSGKPKRTYKHAADTPVEPPADKEHATQRARDALMAIRSAAQITLAMFVSHVGGMGRMSTFGEGAVAHEHADDLGLARAWLDRRKSIKAHPGMYFDPAARVSYYLVDGRLVLGVVEAPPLATSASAEHLCLQATLVLRDVTGKHVWTTRAVYGESEQLRAHVQGQQRAKSHQRTLSTPMLPSAQTAVAREGFPAEVTPTAATLFADGSESWKAYQITRLVLGAQLAKETAAVAQLKAFDE